MHFFIVGAPRCGTTALSRYLKAHPDICFTKPKEPNYFTTAALRHLDDASLAERVRRAYVERFFHPTDPARQTFGEGSVSYLYAPAAIETILRWNPAARFVVMLRDPLAMLRSYHARLYYLLDEDEPDFARAWARQADRRAGRHVPPTCRDPRMLRYAEVARLGAYTQQLQAVAGASRVLPVLHDDLVRDPRAVYTRVLDFIGVRDDGRTEFPRVRASSGFRSRALQKLLQRPPSALVRPAATASDNDARGRPGVGGTDGRAHRGRPSLEPRKLRKRLLAWNTVTRSPDPIDPDVRGEIQATLAADVARLEELTGRDLGHWLDGAVVDGRPATQKTARPGAAGTAEQLLG